MPVQNSQFLSQIPVAHWLVENSPVKLQIARIWPFLGIEGRELSYARVNESLLSSLGTVIDDPADVVAVSENADDVAQATFPLMEFITRYQFPFGAQDAFQDPNDVDAALNAFALRRLLYTYFRRLDDAAGVSGALRTYIADPDNVINMAGAALNLECLDEAYELVTAGDGRPSVIMSHSAARRAYRSVCRNLGFEAPKVQYEWYDPAKGWQEGEVTGFNGTPWLANDAMGGDGSFNRVYFITLGDDGRSGPTRGVTGIVPEALEDTMFVRRETHGTPVDPATTEVAAVTDVWVSWPTGIAVGSQGAISLLENFALVPPCVG